MPSLGLQLNQLILQVSKTIPFRSNLDLHLIRAAMVFEFFAFSIQKWNHYAHAVVHDVDAFRSINLGGKGARTVHGPAMIERRGDQAFGFGNAVFRCHNGLGANHGFRHPRKQSEFAVAKGVMHQAALALHPAGRHSDEMNDREVFSISSANTANRAELADAVGGAQGRYAVDTSVAIGGVRGVEFIATSNPSKVSVRGDGIVDRKREVPSNTEDVPYANVMQARKNVLYYRRSHAFLLLSASVVHTGSSGNCSPIN
jgi:hypothetical protein